MIDLTIILYGGILLLLASFVSKSFLYFYTPLFLLDFNYIGFDVSPVSLWVAYVLPVWIFYFIYCFRYRQDIVFDEVFLVLFVFLLPLFLSVFWSSHKWEGMEQIALFAVSLGTLLVLDATYRQYGVQYLLGVLKVFLLLSLLFMLVNFFLFGLGEDLGRLTAFIAPQSFGIAVSLIAAIVITQSSILRDKLFFGGVGLSVVIASGSRTSLLILFGFLIFCEGRKLVSDFSVYVFSLLTVLVLGVALMLVSNAELPGRALETFNLLTGEVSVEDIGTARWRLEMYSAVFSQWQELSYFKQLFGDGLLSASSVVEHGIVNLRDLDPTFMDRKRVVHNEFLRVLYEAGLFGFLVFCVGVVFYFIRALALSMATKDVFYILSATVVILLTATQNTLSLSLYGSGFAIVTLIFFSAKHRGNGGGENA